jgi:hypothetical protein
VNNHHGWKFTTSDDGEGQDYQWELLGALDARETRFGLEIALGKKYFEPAKRPENVGRGGRDK